LLAVPHKQLESDFDPADVAAQLLRSVARLIERREVERKDEARSRCRQRLGH